ncbi:MULTISPECIES: response regulator [unclassified Breznakia]|uniref:response regulator transcription factor n=1 Tax=unclassified Breznakia TaxID=2623764 RepID=UPI002474A900|nr:MULTISPECIES: response regulator [unclassified Breznakia]MDH6367347.1 two-component system response regulator YesN [Breznakia sp. PH1-1]MDH6404505.1 two-component system response regulator YesN [Breznakia sp. PF1-11]MDH6412214.1 two-component system response regulator YesN [Breznakia sp. PFB1-11]MDH6414514.1 two-component system response regulator YesN [Breznakia sp. PFB1-14]MDH6416878.1 two-component system response regulator YesN [Breznakia sp. PFB1-4]
MVYKVLVVEDEEIIRKGLIYNTNWAALDCVVIGEAGDGEEAIEAIKSKEPDIVLVDVNMPVVNGLDMLKATKDYSYVAIVLSGYAEFSYAQEAIRLGVTRYLTKPVQEQELVAAINSAKKKIQKNRFVSENQEELQKVKEMEVIAIPKAAHKDELVEKMLNYIDMYYQDRIQMRDLADAFNYSEVFLNKRFKHVVGTTFIDFLNKYRVQVSLKYLKEKQYTLEEIGAFVGIPDPKYFRVVFKRYVGYSPREFITILEQTTETR